MIIEPQLYLLFARRIKRPLDHMYIHLTYLCKPKKGYSEQYS